MIGLICAARQRRLSGVFVARELRIGTSSGTLIPDAIVILQFDTAAGEPAVPWTKAPSATADTYAFAIESDRATEPPSTIAAKAQLYSALQRAEDRTQWERRFHCALPTPLWIAPAAPRAEAINQIWQEAWPRGSWMVSSIEHIAVGRALQRLPNWRGRVRLFANLNRELEAPPEPTPAVKVVEAQTPPSPTPPAEPPQPAQVVQVIRIERPIPATPPLLWKLGSQLLDTIEMLFGNALIWLLQRCIDLLDRIQGIADRLGRLRMVLIGLSVEVLLITCVWFTPAIAQLWPAKPAPGP